MKITSLLSLCLCFCFANAQPPSKQKGQYILEWDEKGQTLLIDTIKGTQTLLWVSYPRYNARFYSDNFIMVASSDMRCLFDLNGRQVLEQSHYILWNSNRKDIIRAWVCQRGIWIFLSPDGDTLSYGRSGHNYRPSLDKEINFVRSWNQYRKPKWGALAPDANWLIPPILNDTLDFGNGIASTELCGYKVSFYERYFKKGYYTDLDSTKESLEEMAPYYLFMEPLPSTKSTPSR